MENIYIRYKIINHRTLARPRGASGYLFACHYCPLVRVSVTSCGFRGWWNGVWLGFYPVNKMLETAISSQIVVQLIFKQIYLSPFSQHDYLRRCFSETRQKSTNSNQWTSSNQNYVLYIIIIISVLPKGRYFTASSGTYAAVLAMAWSPPQTQEPRL